MLKYSMHISWSEAQYCYIASLPEWGPGLHAQGASYEEAARRGRELLERLVQSQPHPGPLPEPHLVGTAGTAGTAEPPHLLSCRTKAPAR
jgi:antitoxin HicB